MEIPTLENLGWNLRPLTKSAFERFSQFYGVAVHCLPLDIEHTHICLDLRKRKILLVNSGLSEVEALYYSWYGCLRLINQDRQTAETVALCAIMPQSRLGYSYFASQNIPERLIGKRNTLFEMGGY